MIGEALEEGEWNQCFFGSVRSQDVEEGCRRFWAKRQVERFIRDGNGKIIEVIRTEVDRTRPVLLYFDFSNPKRT